MAYQVVQQNLETWLARAARGLAGCRRRLDGRPGAGIGRA